MKILKITDCKGCPFAQQISTSKHRRVQCNKKFKVIASEDRQEHEDFFVDFQGALPIPEWCPLENA